MGDGKNENLEEGGGGGVFIIEDTIEDGVVGNGHHEEKSNETIGSVTYRYGVFGFAFFSNAQQQQKLKERNKCQAIIGRKSLP